MSCLRESIRRMDGALPELLAAVENAPTLVAMMLAAWHLGRAIAVAVVEDVLNERAQRPTEWPLCPQCGKKLESKGFGARSLKGLIGTVSWKRRKGRCPNRCKIGQIAPLDTELGLKPNQRTSDALVRAACTLAIFVPFGTVRELLSALIGIEVSTTSIWNWVQMVGAQAKARIERQLQALAAGVQPPEEEIEAEVAKLPLVIGGDGVLVPFRPQGGQPAGRTVWREIKVGVVARLGQRITKTGKPVTKLLRKRLVAVRGNIDTFRPLLWWESVRQGVLTAETVVWVSDGGRGFWRLFREQFETYAHGILDFYHAAQNLWKGAKAWLDGRTKQSHQWFAEMRHKLRHGEADQVRATIKAILDQEDLADSKRKTLQNLHTYLDNHRNHIKYAQFKEWGLPIGSGVVESACKWLIQQRFKGVGMRWSDDGFDHLLYLRLDWVNGRFDDLFDLPVLGSA